MKISNTVRNMALMSSKSKQKNQKSKSNNSKKNSKNNSGRVTVYIGFNASGAMAQIARAKTKSQAAALERSFRATLENAKRYNSDQATIRAIKKAIGKAGTKVKALGKEERMENMRKVAASADNRRAERRINEELLRMRQARKRREQADVTDPQNVLDKKEEKIRDEVQRRFEEDVIERVDNGFDIVCDGIELSSELQNVEAMGSTAVDVIL